MEELGITVVSKLNMSLQCEMIVKGANAVLGSCFGARKYNISQYNLGETKTGILYSSGHHTTRKMNWRMSREE